MDHYDHLKEQSYKYLDEAEQILSGDEADASLEEQFDSLKAYFHNFDVLNTYWREARDQLRALAALKAETEGTDLGVEIYNYYWRLIDNVFDGDDDFYAEATEQALFATVDSLEDPDLTYEEDELAIVASDLEGHLRWVHGHYTQRDDEAEPSGPENEFMLWLDDKLDPPVRMNCYDALFYAAFCAGQASKADIYDAYRDVRRGVGYASVESALGVGSMVSLESRLEEGLQPGDVLIFNGDSAAHVALSMGGRSVMSLWGHNGGSFSRLPLNDILGDYKLTDIKVAPKGSGIF